jgi:hypothetical protein
MQPAGRWADIARKCGDLALSDACRDNLVGGYIDERGGLAHLASPLAVQGVVEIHEATTLLPVKRGSLETWRLNNLHLRTARRLFSRYDTRRPVSGRWLAQCWRRWSYMLNEV